ncbi:T9SS type A sorting domain-containing protein [uncultured Polaribacter sp.]|uniref:T9SS type A sorting domain-containing protein n=1 Tax=uncultured Polaribacter sp. TaxID=174711 RepID=UPI00262978A0|nr:T9SS type A sorting domain-containing protein [uncultured Polaribacter sp.]
MKKLATLIFFLLLFTNVKAQITIDYKTTKKPEDFLKNIDISSFNSGILYDRVIPYAKLSTFNTSENNTSNVTHFEQSLSELYRASKKKKFTSVEKFRQQYNQAENIVNIGIINTSFHQLNYNKKDEQKGGLRLKNKKLTIIKNKNAFTKKDILIIAPLKRRAKGTSITYQFTKDFILGTKNKIRKLIADFGNDKTITILENGKLLMNEIAVEYNSNGKKTLIFSVEFKDGSKKQTKGTIFVKNVVTNALRSSNIIQTRYILNSQYSFKGYEESSAIFGELEYEIFYHTNNGVPENKLLKPILFIDGFDPQDERKILQSEMPLGINDPNPSIERLMVYGNNDTPIIPELRNLGYDVILVNHPVYYRNGKEIDGGADYIERNAMNHITLYQKLNKKLMDNGSNEELVIIGPSMGGQISRFALAYMENKFTDTNDNKWKHNTRLWISVDSPHQGASISVGAQANVYFLGFIHGEQKAKDTYEKSLKSVASRQMLIQQFSAGSSFSKPSLFNQYYSNLKSNGLPNSKGYPLNLRKISITNGAINGNKNGSEGEGVLDIRGYADFWIGNVRGFLNKLNYTKGSWQNNEVYFGKVDKVFSGYSYAVSYTNQFSKGSLDVVPGGTFNTQGVLKDEIVEGLENNSSIDRISVGTYKPNHTFMPTHSTLDTNGFTNWYQPINKNLVCSNQTPFDTYFGETRNTEHVSFTITSKNWLFEELAGNQQQPPIPYSSMTGNENAVTGQYLTYRVDPIVGNTSYNWYFDVGGNTGTNIGGWSIISNNGDEVVVKVGQAGTTVVVCRITNTCASSLKYKYVNVTSSSGGGGGGNGDPCDGNFRFSSNPMKSNNSLNKVIIEPDPCNDNLRFATSSESENLEYNITIHNLYSEKVYSKTQNTTEFSVNSLKRGFYVVRFQNGKGKIISKRLIIE